MCGLKLTQMCLLVMLIGFHVGGFLGKLIVEMSLIGYLVGTAIAWFVIIGDVSPAVVSSIFGIEKTWGLRLFLIVAIGVCVVLPLSLVKDITSLSSASNVAIGIYSIFVLQLLFSTLPRILSGDWLDGANFWKPDGVLQCLPIFGISFLCQTVIFVLYDALPEPSVKKMEHVVDTAMDIVLLLSFTVGFSGYVRYFDDGVQGDLLNNYKHDFISEFIRLGFCISTILSFPLLVFPCRSSINSLISSARLDVTPTGGTYIPHDRFFVITCLLVIGTVICGVLFPSVEFVMALVGATMGAMLTFILPSYIFLIVSGEDHSKAVAKVLFVTGICLLCLSTFSVLSISESQMKEAEMSPVIQPPVLNPPTLKPNTTFVKSSEQVKKVEVLLNKNEKSNKSTLQGGEVHDEMKRNIIDEQKVLVPQRNTAEVVEDSRKEPVLPREGIVRQLPVDGRKPAEDQDTRLAEKRFIQQPDTNLDSKKKDDSEEKDPTLNDEVRIAGERKILNNGEDVPSHVKPITVQQNKPRTNTSLTDERTFVVDKERSVEQNLGSENVVINKTIADVNTDYLETVGRETKQDEMKDQNTLTNNSEARMDSIKSLRKFQPPLLLRKQLQQSRIKLIERSRRKTSSDDEDF
ncbi:Hypothetical predicted protein [Paramuricea clavata]|uniref:Amino acid transporter transmembrane domain-containing protein n=1 Tax=Paramuricea clavata TaxID=317549 RepID=A0A6S7GUT8_PARCT|nr:Hypothetical predicted protein [Paramuricea clavata]